MALLEKNITIKEPTNLNPQDNKPVKFKDENGDKYTLWKTSKDKNSGDIRESAAYGSFKELEYGGDGQTIGIVYAEEQKSFVNDANKTINYTERTVRLLKPSSEIKENTPPTTYVSPNMQGGANTAIKQPSTNDSIRENVALKMVSEIIASGKMELTEWKKWADEFYHFKPSEKSQEKPQEKTKGMASISDEGEIQVSEVPF